MDTGQAEPIQRELNFPGTNFRANATVSPKDRNSVRFREGLGQIRVEISRDG